MSFRTLEFKDSALVLLDQRKLPAAVEHVVVRSARWPRLLEPGLFLVADVRGEDLSGLEQRELLQGSALLVAVAQRAHDHFHAVAATQRQSGDQRVMFLYLPAESGQ